MRAAPTTTESLLWAELSGSKLGVGFRRQVPLGRYIADFLAPSDKLIVEVDGGGGVTRWIEARAMPDAIARLLARHGLGPRPPPKPPPKGQLRLAFPLA